MADLTLLSGYKMSTEGVYKKGSNSDEFRLF